MFLVVAAPGLLSAACAHGRSPITRRIRSNAFKNFSAALTSRCAAPAPTHTGNTQVWVLVDQMPLRQGPGDQDGIIALGGFVHNDPHIPGCGRAT